MTRRACRVGLAPSRRRMAFLWTRLEPHFRYARSVLQAMLENRLIPRSQIMP